jgi:cbb3-type cytochrome c oxidase subunit I
LLDTPRQENKAILAFIVAGAAWFAVGTIYGAFSAIHLVNPEVLTGPVVFGRTRPAHVNTMIFGFVSNLLIGVAHYIVPAVLRTRLWSTGLAWASFVLWNLVVLSGEVTFAMGITQGREYAEYIWPADVALVVALVCMLVNMIMTIINRQEKILYVSVWYTMGMLVTMAGVYPIGNVMWHYNGAMPGLVDSIYLWYYGHNLVGLLLTPLATAMAYFVFPRVARTPLYSHTLSLAGFWILVALYTHIGGHHLLQTPIPNWLKAVSIIDSFAMFVPVFIVLGNLWLTIRGRFGMVWNDPGGRLVLVGMFWYFVTCVQGPLQSLPEVQKVTHFTQWVVGHAHIAVLGFSGFIALGAAYHVLPSLTGRGLWSKRLVSLQFGLLMFGLVGFFLVLSIAGLIQGHGWYQQGETEYRVLPQLAPYMVLRALSGMFIITAAFIGLFNLLMSIWRGPKATEGDLAEGSVI